MIIDNDDNEHLFSCNFKGEKKVRLMLENKEVLNVVSWSNNFEIHKEKTATETKEKTPKSCRKKQEN